MRDLCLALLQGLFGCSGGINDGPIDRANIILFLKPGDLGRGVGCIALATTNTALSGRKVGCQKEADKVDVMLERSLAYRSAFHFSGKHRIDYHGMALDKDA